MRRTITLSIIVAAILAVVGLGGCAQNPNPYLELHQSQLNLKKMQGRLEELNQIIEQRAGKQPASLPCPPRIGGQCTRNYGPGTFTIYTTPTPGHPRGGAIIRQLPATGAVLSENATGPVVAIYLAIFTSKGIIDFYNPGFTFKEAAHARHLQLHSPGNSPGLHRAA